MRCKCKLCYNMFEQLPDKVASDPQVIRRGNIVSAVCVAMTLLLIAGLVTVAAFKEDAHKVTVSPITVSKYNSIADKDSLSCRCTTIFQPFGNIATVEHESDTICKMDWIKGLELLESSYNSVSERSRGQSLVIWVTDAHSKCMLARNFLNDAMEGLHNTTYASVEVQTPEVVHEIVSGHYKDGLERSRREFMRMALFAKSSTIRTRPINLNTFTLEDIRIAAFEKDFPSEPVPHALSNGSETTTQQWEFPFFPPNQEFYNNENSPTLDRRHSNPHGQAGTLTEVAPNASVGSLLWPLMPQPSFWWETIQKYSDPPCNCIANPRCTVRLCDTNTTIANNLRFMFTYLGKPGYACLTLECTLDEMYHEFPLDLSNIHSDVWWGFMHSIVVKEQTWDMNASLDDAFQAIPSVSRQFGVDFAALNFSSKFETYGKAREQLFISDEDFHVHPDFNSYFGTCAPSSCSYIESRRKNPAELLQILASFGGGIAAAARLVSILVFRTWLFMSPRGLSKHTRRWTMGEVWKPHSSSKENPPAAAKAVWNPLHAAKSMETDTDDPGPSRSCSPDPTTVSTTALVASHRLKTARVPTTDSSSNSSSD